MSNRDCSNVDPFSYFNFTLLEKINMKNSIITYFVIKKKSISSITVSHPAANFMLKVNNKSTGARC